jgi:hypothetical protein
MPPDVDVRERWLEMMLFLRYEEILGVKLPLFLSSSWISSVVAEQVASHFSSYRPCGSVGLAW